MSGRFSGLEDLNKRNQKRADFDKLDLIKLRDASDEDLAWIQSCYDPQDPQHIFIQNVWSSRLLAHELKNIRFFTIMGICSSVGCVILGVVLGAIATSCSG